MKRPDFLILGTAKAGTTSLYHYIKQHPEICLSQPKETWFFDSLEYNRGLTYYWETYFCHHCEDQKVGEVASSYLYVPYVAQRLAQTVPHAKLIAILRNPVDRAFSDWWMLFHQGIETLSFEDAVEDNLRRLENGPFLDTVGQWQEHLSHIQERRSLKYRTYLDYGYYEIQIRRYLQSFPEKQLRIFFFDDLRQDSVTCYTDLMDFLDLESGAEVEHFTPHNVAIPNRFLGRLANTLARTKITHILPFWFKGVVNQVFSRLGKRTELKASTRQGLLQHYYEYNQKLSELLGRELDNWQY